MQEAKLIRLLLYEDEDNTTLFPVVIEPEVSVWEAVVRVLPPSVNVEEWVVEDWDGNVVARDRASGAVRSGSWFSARPCNGLSLEAWRKVLPSSQIHRELDIEIFHRSLVSIKPVGYLSLPSHNYLQLKVEEEKIILLHEEGILIGKRSNDEEFQDLIQLDTPPLSFEIDSDGRFLLLFPDRVEIIDPEYPNQIRRLFFVSDAPRYENSRLVCMGYEQGDIWLLNNRGEIYRPENPERSTYSIGITNIEKAIYDTMSFMAFDTITSRLIVYRLGGGAVHILDDLTGSLNTFCMDDQGRIYYINSSKGLKILHQDGSYIAQMTKRKEYEMFTSPVSACVTGNILHVLDGEKVFMYEFQWEIG